MIDAAIREVDRGLSADWRKPDGAAATGNLAQLREALLRARTQAVARETVHEPILVGVARWVADWIPDINDPLLAAMGRVELAIAESPGPLPGEMANG